MAYYSLQTGRLHKKLKQKDWLKYLRAMKAGFIKLSTICLINHLMHIFNAILFLKLQARMLKIIFWRQAILEMYAEQH